MSSRFVFNGALVLVIASSFLSSPAWAQPLDPVQPPPSASSLVTATNAMLRPGDVVSPLVLPMPSSLRGFSTGFRNPPEDGDTAFFVCDTGLRASEQRENNAIATGFFARSGAVEQLIYRYPSAAAAQRVWATLGNAIDRGCVGGAPVRDESVQASAKQIAGIDVPGWGVLTSGSVGVSYATVHLVGDAIQLVELNTRGGGALPRRAPDAVQELSVVLAQRWLQRATLPLTQEPALTRAEESMLQPGDMPESLPILPPQAGARSNFAFQQPGADTLAPCFVTPVRAVPRAERSFSAAIGSDGFGPALSGGGALFQRVYVYASQDAARRAWEVLSSQAKRCSKGQDQPVAGNEDLNRLTNDVSELTFGGVPGIWVRELSTSLGRVNSRSKDYTIYLLMGDAIQQVRYSVARPGLGQVPLDQLPVNQLAEKLANRWVAAGAQ
jgi:hypothetical protein